VRTIYRSFYAAETRLSILSPTLELYLRHVAAIGCLIIYHEGSEERAVLPYRSLSFPSVHCGNIMNVQTVSTARDFWR